MWWITKKSVICIKRQKRTKVYKFSKFLNQLSQSLTTPDAKTIHGRWEFVVASLDATLDLMRPYTVVCQFKIWGHDYRFPLRPCSGFQRLWDKSLPLQSSSVSVIVKNKIHLITIIINVIIIIVVSGIHPGKRKKYRHRCVPNLSVKWKRDNYQIWKTHSITLPRKSNTRIRQVEFPLWDFRDNFSTKWKLCLTFCSMYNS